VVNNNVERAAVPTRSAWNNGPPRAAANSPSTSQNVIEKEITSSLLVDETDNVTNIEKISLDIPSEKYEIAQKPQVVGNIGPAIALRTNHYLFTPKRKLEFFQYEVEIKRPASGTRKELSSDRAIKNKPLMK
jgi:hypothetical protein